MELTPSRQIALDDALLLLEQHGINPKDVPTFGLTEEGYLKFRRNALTGELSRDIDNQPSMTSETWPEGFPVRQFLDRVAVFRGDHP